MPDLLKYDAAKTDICCFLILQQIIVVASPEDQSSVKTLSGDIKPNPI